MNRRKFLLWSGAAAAAIGPLGAGWIKLSRPERVRFTQLPRARLGVTFQPQEMELIRLLGRHSRGVYAFGGPVLARAAGRVPPWTSFLIGARDLAGLKRELFRFGVEPVATPNAPPGFIQFALGGINYKALNLDIDDFCHRNCVESRLNLIPFAHAFVAYECATQLVHDPHGALEAKGGDGRYALKLVARPRSPLAALDTWLSGIFDSELLGFHRPVAFAELERLTLESTAPPEERALVNERFVNYITDLIHLRGYEACRPFILSPLVREATRAGMSLDIAAVDRRATALLAERGSFEEHTFLRLLNRSLGGQDLYQQMFNNVDHYLLANAMSVRRLDLMKHLV